MQTRCRLRKTGAAVIVLGSIAALLLLPFFGVPASAGGAVGPASGELVEIAAAEQPLVLGAEAVQVTLTAPGLRSLAEGAVVYLVLEGLRSATPPGITYNVYLGLPEGAPAAGPQDRHYVGAFGFFNASGSSADSGGATAAFEVTGLALSLAEVGAQEDGLPLRIEPAGRPNPAADPVVARISLIAR